MRQKINRHILQTRFQTTRLKQHLSLQDKISQERVSTEDNKQDVRNVNPVSPYGVDHTLQW